MDSILQKVGGGTGSDECTATKSMVLAGYKAVTADSNDEAEEGTLDVQSILSFSAAPYSATQIVFTWRNPAKGAFSGVIIVGKEGGYPTGITDGTRYYKGFGNNASAGGVSSALVSTSLTPNVTHHFRAFSYALKNDEEWVNDTYYTDTITILRGFQTFTAAGTFTVPEGVNKIDIFCVGGGGGGGYSNWMEGGCNGGGAGYARTVKNINVSPRAVLNVSVGAGAGTYASNGSASSVYSGSTILCSADGGMNGESSYAGNKFASGGSGGGHGAYHNPRATNQEAYAGSGGSNGGYGGYSIPVGNAGSSVVGGPGQGTTTRAFGEADGTLYAGGGGGGGSSAKSSNRGAYGGAGGGGNGAQYAVGYPPASPTAGTAGTGGGGGGGNSSLYGGVGGSGICIIRWGY